MIYHYNTHPIFYSLSGNGPVVVLVHGFLESSTMWNKIVPELSNSYTLLVVDLPGHGLSDCVSEIHTMELFAKVLQALLLNLRIHKASFVGHSMGGYVLLAFAEYYPEMMDALILLNSTSTKDNDSRKANRDRALQYIEKEKKTIISMAISNLFSDTSRNTYKAEIESLKKEAFSFPSKGITAAIIGMRDRQDRTQILKNFGHYKLLICGKRDPIVPLEVSKYVSEKTGTPLKIIDGGHMSWLENSKELLNFLHFNE